MRALYHHRTQGRGVEAIHISGFCRGLEQLGYEVEVVGPPGVRVDPERVVAAERGKTGTVWGWVARHAPQFVFELLEIGYNLAAIPRLWGRCQAVRPELIYERYSLYNATAAIVGRLTRTPVILEVNDTVEVDRTRQGKRVILRSLAARIERRILASATGIVVVSRYLGEQLVAAGVPAGRIRVTPNAVDAEQFDPSATDGRAARSRWGLENCTVLGFAGSFTKWHRVELLIEAAAMLAPEFSNLRLLLVGDGFERAAAEDLARRRRIEERVVFAGKVGHAEMPSCIAAMDVGVMPESNLFGSPMKVFEYMAMGRPVVAPRYGPLEEVVEDGKHGLLFSPGDVGALSDCLRQLIANPALRRQMGQAARRQILLNHQWAHNARAALAFLPPRMTPVAPVPVDQVETAAADAPERGARAA